MLRRAAARPGHDRLSFIVVPPFRYWSWQEPAHQPDPIQSCWTSHSTPWAATSGGRMCPASTQRICLGSRAASCRRTAASRGTVLSHRPFIKNTGRGLIWETNWAGLTLSSSSRTKAGTCGRQARTERRYCHPLLPVSDGFSVARFGASQTRRPGIEPSSRGASRSRSRSGSRSRSTSTSGKVWRPPRRPIVQGTAAPQARSALEARSAPAPDHGPRQPAPEPSPSGPRSRAARGRQSDNKEVRRVTVPVTGSKILVIDCGW